MCAVAVLKKKAIWRKKKRRKRRYKVRPLNRRRWVHGFYISYFRRMKDIDPEQFFKYTRMNKMMFDALLTRVSPLIRKINMNQALCPEERLCMTLQYVIYWTEMKHYSWQVFLICSFLSQGSSLQTIAWKYQVGKSTVHSIVKETCKAICAVLEPEYLKAPTSAADWQKIAREFSEKWNFPHCVGT